MFIIKLIKSFNISCTILNIIEFFLIKIFYVLYISDTHIEYFVFQIPELMYLSQVCMLYVYNVFINLENFLNLQQTLL